MKLGASLTPFSDEIDAFRLEYKNKRAECDVLADLLKNLLNGNFEAATPDNDLFVILNLKEKIDTLELIVDITNDTKKEINTRFEDVVLIFKGVIDIEQGEDKVKFFREKYVSLFSKSPEKSTPFLKNVITKELAHLPKEIIYDLRFALGRKEVRLAESLVNTPENIIERFINSDPPNKMYRSAFATTLERIRFFESMYVTYKENLEKLEPYSSQLVQKDKKHFDILKREINNKRLPKESTIKIINRMIKNFSKVPNLKVSSPANMTPAYKKSISSRPTLPPSQSTPDLLNDPKALLEATLGFGLMQVRGIPGIIENKIDVFFETYKTSVLEIFENTDFLATLPRIKGVIEFELKQKLSGTDLAQVQAILESINTDVTDLYKKQQQPGKTKINSKKKSSIRIQ